MVKYVDSFGIEHAAKVEPESVFEAAIRALYRLDSSFRTEEDGKGFSLGIDFPSYIRLITLFCCRKGSVG